MDVPDEYVVDTEVVNVSDTSELKENGTDVGKSDCSSPDALCAVVVV